MTGDLVSPKIDTAYLLDILVDLLNTPSPTGFTHRAADRVVEAMQGLGLAPKMTRKGAVVAELAGRSAEEPRGLTAHVDTLGAMVKEIKKSGRLRLTKLGGYAWNAAEGGDAPFSPTPVTKCGGPSSSTRRPPTSTAGR